MQPESRNPYRTAVAVVSRIHNALRIHRQAESSAQAHIGVGFYRLLAPVGKPSISQQESISPRAR